MDMLVEADDDCTHIFAREVIELRVPLHVPPPPLPPIHRYVSISIPALLDDFADDAQPSLALRAALLFLWASGGTIVGLALAVAWS